MKIINPFIIGETPIDQPALLEASAGTGKTFTLIRIVRDLIAKEGKSLKEILIVTFTKKAAGELKERIREILEDPFDETVPEPYTEEELARLKEAALMADEAPIYTIHGFCQGVLQSFPFESGSEFRLNVSEKEELLSEVILDYLREIEKSSEDSLISRLRRTFLKKYSSFEEALTEAEKIISRLMNTPSANIVPDQVTEENYLKMIDLYQPTGKNEEAIEENRQKHKEKVETALFEAALWSEIPDRLAAKKEEQGVITFNDMIDRLYRLLNNEPADGETNNTVNPKKNKGTLLIKALRKQYSVLLIDEFQDTDIRQWTIFKRIFSDNGGVYFLIGDPKQSIYGFRGTELQVYHDAAGSIPEERRFLLPTNYRSAPPLIEGINRLFEPLFHKNFSGQKIDFVPVEAGSSAGLLQKKGADSPPIEFIPYIKTDQTDQSGDKSAGGTEALKTSTSEINTFYDKAIVRKIIELISPANQYQLYDKDKKEYRSVTAEDIAVLSETNDRLSAVEAQLSLYGIPSNNAKAKNITETAEAADLIFLLETLSDPFDYGRIKAVLLLPLFGLSLKALIYLEENALLDRIIDRFHRWSREITGGAFIEVSEEILTSGSLFAEILRNAGYPDKKEISLIALPYRERILQYIDGERFYTNTSHLIEILYNAIRFKGIKLEDLADYLKEDLEVKSEDENETPDTGIRIDKEVLGVTLSTIHLSKGLEYPIVFFHAGCSGLQAKNPQTYLKTGDKSRTIRLFPDDNFKEDALHYIWEEKKRLYYVGMTRPVSKLYLPLHRTPINTQSRIQAFYNETFPGYAEKLIADGLLKEEAAFPMLGAFGEKVPSKEKKNFKLAQYSFSLFDYICDQIKKNPEVFALSLEEQSDPNFRYQNTRQGQNDRSNLNFIKEISRQTLIAPRFLTNPVDFSERTVPVLSYSGLTAGEDHTNNHGTSHSIDKVRDSEVSPLTEITVTELPDLPGDKTEKNRILGAGPEFGTMIHNIFERIDLHNPTLAGEETEQIIEEETSRFYSPDKLSAARPLVRELLTSVLTTPLTPLDSRPLSDPEITPFVKELEFLIKIKEGSLLDNKPIPAVSQKEGFLKGYIDLIFRCNGKVYIADWKTNLSDGYRENNLKEMMEHHRYDLQYKIYQTALMQYLKRENPAFSYNDFGGVFYFFVRGMNPGTPEEGVFFDRISEEEFDLFSKGLI